MTPQQAADEVSADDLRWAVARLHNLASGDEFQDEDEVAVRFVEGWHRDHARAVAPAGGDLQALRDAFVQELWDMRGGNDKHPDDDAFADGVLDDAYRLADVAHRCAPVAAPPSEDEDSPADIRAQGWTVAVHNDYRLNGEAHTFWLFTSGDRAVKGEGRTDAAALNVIRRRLAEENR